MTSRQKIADLVAEIEAVSNSTNKKTINSKLS